MRVKPINKNLVFYQLSRAGKAFLIPWFFGKKKVPFKPTFVSLEVEDTCFFRCQHCDIWKKEKAPKRMDLEQMKKLVIILKKWLGTFQLNLTGGEPFLNEDIFSLIKFASGQGILVHVNSNGFLINKELAKEIIESGLNSLSISLDSLDSKLYNQLRGNKGAFQGAISALKTINGLRQPKKLFLSMVTVIMKQNLNELEKLVFWAKKQDLDAIFFQALWQNFDVKYKPLWFKSSDLWPNDIKKVNKVMNRLSQMKAEDYPIGNVRSDFHYYKLYFANPVRFGERNPCLAGLNNFNIDITGKVRLCFNFPPVGNILKEKPQAIWNGEKAQRQRLKIARCKRGCKILLCNNPLSRKEAINLLLGSTVGKIKKALKANEKN